MTSADTASRMLSTALTSVRMTRLIHAAAGIVVIVSCLQAGVLIQQHFGIPVPGSVLGMVLLLVLLQTRLVPDIWLHGTCTSLLLLLPALFVPVYALPVSDPAFWSHYGLTLVPAAVVGVAITLSVTGWLAGRMRRQ